MSTQKLRVIEYAINSLGGNSELICLQDVIEVARQNFGFDGSVQQIVNYLMDTSEFQLVEHCEPGTNSRAWYVLDHRQRAKREQIPVPPSTRPQPAR